MPYEYVKHAVCGQLYHTCVTIGERIRQCRIELDMTQQQLADAVGMTKASVSGLELGTSKSPSASNLLPIARALKVHPEWLVTGKGERRALSPVQQRISQAMKAAGLKPFDLADACGGTIAPQSIEAWLDGIAEPSRGEIEAIAAALDTSASWIETGLEAVQETGHARAIYDTRGEPAPENLSQVEIDMIRALRQLDDDRRRRILQSVDDAVELHQLKDAASGGGSG